jgi:hypothetical protein
LADLLAAWCFHRFLGLNERLDQTRLGSFSRHVTFNTLSLTPKTKASVPSL